MLILEVKMNIQQVNAYMAEKCGIKISGGKYFVYNYFKMFRSDYKEGTYANHIQDADIDMEWTIQDPRCREIVREKFSITTKYTPPNEYGWMSYKDDDTDGIKPFSKGGTPAEAEIACITAIAESDNGD